MDHDERARQFVYAFIQQQGSYHNHKEQMIYVLSTAYAGAAAVLVAKPVSCAWEFLACIGVVGGLVLWLIAWQLDQRQDAAAYVDAGYAVAARWLTTPPLAGDLQIPEGGDRRWPRALAGALPAAHRRLRERLRWPSIVPLGALLLLLVAAVVRQAIG